jgi:hypothetical protein
MSVIAGLTAAGLLALVLVRGMRRRGQPAAACTLGGALCALNPLTLEALRLGHATELLAALLCVGAVLAALRRRSLASAVLLGVALATAQWAAIAVLPVLAATHAARLRLLAIAMGVALLVALGMIAAGGGPAGQVSWPLLLAVPLTALWWSSPRRTPDDALALLALLFLANSVLGGAGQADEFVPFILSLVAWEGLTRRGLPVVALVSTAAIWIAGAGANDMYLVATLPVGVWLAARLYLPASGLLRLRAWPVPAPRTPATH